MNGCDSFCLFLLEFFTMQDVSMLEAAERLMVLRHHVDPGRVLLIISGPVVVFGDPSRRHPTDRCISPNQSLHSP